MPGSSPLLRPQGVRRYEPPAHSRLQQASFHPSSYPPIGEGFPELPPRPVLRYAGFETLNSGRDPGVAKRTGEGRTRAALPSVASLGYAVCGLPLHLD